MKKLTFLLSALFIALTSVFAESLEPTPITVNPTEWKISDLALENDEAEAAQKFSYSAESGADVNVSLLSNNAAFKWNGEDSTLYFTATAADTYKATLLFSTENAADELVKVPVEIVVVEPVKPTPITVDPESWKISDLALENDEAKASQKFSYSAKSEAEVNVSLLGNNAAFKWNEEDSTLTFSATAADTYKDTLLFSTENAADEAVKVPVEITVVEPAVVPILSIEKSGVQAFESKEFVRGQQESVSFKDTLWSAISGQGFDLADLKIKKLNEESIFSADFENEDKLRFFIAYEATAAVEAKDTIVVYVENTELSDTVFVSLTVTEIVPVITPDATVMAWGEVELAEAQEGISKSIDAEVTPDVEKSWTIQGAEKNFDVTWENDELTVVFTAEEAGEYTATLTLIARGADDVNIELSAKVNAPLPTPTNCAEAAEAALSVSKNNELYNDGAEYTIPGFVTEIAYAWKDGSMSFWMADKEDGGKVLEAYKCAIEKEEDAVRVGDSVKVTGKLTKYNTTPEFAAGCTVEIVKRYVPKNLGEKTIAEFLELKNMVDTCILTGVIANVVNTEYGNFDLAEEKDTLYIYGLKDAAGAYCFDAKGLAEGDTLTIKATYNEFKGSPQAKNAIFVDVKKAPVKPTTEISLDKTEAELKVGKTLKLNVTRDGTDELTWASSNEAIATVENGVVTAVAVGEAIISATANEKTAECKITVVEPVAPAAGWVTDPADLSAGDLIVIANFDHSYALSTDQVNESGKAVFRLAKEFDESNISDEFEQIELVASGENFKLKVAEGFLYYDASWDKNWMGTNETGSEFQFVQSGDTIFIVEQANERIMLYNYNDGNSPRFAIYKKTSSLRSSGAVAILRLGEVEIVPTTEIAIVPAEAELEAGKTLKLKVERDGNDELTWTSSDEAIATVANGVVTGVAEGEVIITATANNISAECKITVTPEIIVPSAGEWVADPSILKAGDKIVITNYAKTKAMSTEQVAAEGKSYYRGETNFDETAIADDVEVVELVASGENFKLKVSGGFLYFDPDWMTAGKDGAKQNWLGTNETGTDFRFELSGDTVFIANDYGYIFHNAQSTRFAHYVGTSSMRKNATAVFLLGDQEEIPTTQIVVEPAEAEVTVGKTIKLTARRNGNDPLTWASSNVAIATVENGVVTGVAAGEATITATANGKSAECKVTVKEAKVIEVKDCASAAEAALSVEKDNELFNDGAEYTIQGYVTSIKTAYSSQYNNISFWMADTKDGGEVLQAYRAACASADDAVRVGDLVKVTGKLTKYGSTPEFAAGCTYEFVERGEAPKNLGEKTIAEFLELKNMIDTCILTGVVDSIKDTKYGNLYISDGTSLYIYGLLTPDGQAQQFESLGVEVGDTLTIKATYNEFKGAPQAKNAIFVSNKKGSGEVPPTPIPIDVDTIQLDITASMAFFFSEMGAAYWEVDAWNEEETYPDLYFLIDAVQKTRIAGKYAVYEGMLKISENDSIEFISGEATITNLEPATESSYGLYNIVVILYDEDENVYAYTFDVEIAAFDYDAYDEGAEDYEIFLEDGIEDQAIENTEAGFDANAPIYNIQGMQVGRQQGIILIQDGHKFMIAQ